MRKNGKNKDGATAFLMRCDAMRDMVFLSTACDCFVSCLWFDDLRAFELRGGKKIERY